MKQYRQLILVAEIVQKHFLNKNSRFSCIRLSDNIVNMATLEDGRENHARSMLYAFIGPCKRRALPFAYKPQEKQLQIRMTDEPTSKRSKMASSLAQLKQLTTVVADTGDFEGKRFLNSSNIIFLGTTKTLFLLTHWPGILCFFGVFMLKTQFFVCYIVNH